MRIIDCTPGFQKTLSCLFISKLFNVKCWIYIGSLNFLKLPILLLKAFILKACSKNRHIRALQEMILIIIILLNDTD